MPKAFKKPQGKKPQRKKPEKITIVTRAATLSAVLTQELRNAHSRACVENPVLAVLLFDMIIESCTIKRRLSEVWKHLKK